MTPDQPDRTYALVDMLDCAESATERELLFGFILNVFEQDQDRRPSHVITNQ